MAGTSSVSGSSGSSGSSGEDTNDGEAFKGVGGEAKKNAEKNAKLAEDQAIKNQDFQAAAARASSRIRAAGQARVDP